MSSPLTKDLLKAEEVSSTVGIADVLRPNFYRQENWLEKFCESMFTIKDRGTSIKSECYFGLIQFVSCVYILPVVSSQLAPAGFNADKNVVVTSAVTGMGCIISGLLTNLPIIVAPTPSVSIFYSVYLQENNLRKWEGNQAVCVAGVCLMIFGYKPLSKVITNLIPKPIQVGTAVGIGLITALAGALDINMVRSGEFTIVTSGPITTEVILTIFGIVALVILLARHVQGAFSYVLMFNTFVWWWDKDGWPDVIAETPRTNMGNFGHKAQVNGPLTLSLLFLSILVLRGLMRSFSQMAGLIKESGSTPKGSLLFLICGFTTVLSGLLSGPPVLLSPESAAGIKAGAKTGLSTLVCGILFCIATFFAPFFKAIPGAATSPLLIMVGILMFQSVQRVDWSSIEEASTVFTVLFFIPMTYSIMTGVVTGYIVYIVVLLFSVPFIAKFKRKYIDGIEGEEEEMHDTQGDEDKGDDEDRIEADRMPKHSGTLKDNTSTTLTPSSKSNVSARVGKAIYKHLTQESKYIVDMSSALVGDDVGGGNLISGDSNGSNSSKFVRSRTIH